MEKYLLDVKHLKTTFQTQAGQVQAVRDISFRIGEEECVGIVGESGCGKSVTMLSVMHLLDDNASMSAESICFDGQEISKYTDAQMRKLDGNKIGMIFQDPMTSLNPVFTIAQQFAEPLSRHLHLKGEDARNKARNMLEMVGIPMPQERLSQYPHELSGGLRQRVMIAVAMCCNPKLLIADEPTTALDVTVQAQILELMGKMKDTCHSSVILISHDLGVISTLASRVLVMYGGKIVEESTVDELFYEPMHPYTKGLLASIPSKSGTKLVPIYGTPPDLLDPPKGCPFAARCSCCMKICQQVMPGIHKATDSHSCRCWLYHPQVAKHREEMSCR